MATRKTTKKATTYKVIKHVKSGKSSTVESGLTQSAANQLKARCTKMWGSDALYTVKKS